MKIVLPEEFNTYEGPGGYIASKVYIDVNKQVDKCSFIKAKIPKGKKALYHHHDKLVEIFYFLKPAKMKINGETHELVVGAMAIMDPGDKHELYAEEDDLEFFVMKVPEVEDDKYLD